MRRIRLTPILAVWFIAASAATAAVTPVWAVPPISRNVTLHARLTDYPI